MKNDSTHNSFDGPNSIGYALNLFQSESNPDQGVSDFFQIVQSKIAHHISKSNHSKNQGIHSFLHLLDGGLTILSPLHLASELGNYPTVYWLLKHSYDRNHQNSYHLTALHFVCLGKDSIHDRIKIVNLLLSSTQPSSLFEDPIPNSKSELLEKKTQLGYTPLMMASEEGNIEMVQHLLSLEADLRAKNEYKQTSLILATEKGHLDIVKLIHSHDCRLHPLVSLVPPENPFQPQPPDLHQIHVENKYDKNAFLVAAEFGVVEVMEWLVKEVRYPITHCNQKQYRRVSALMYAACIPDNSKRDQIVDILLSSPQILHPPTPPQSRGRPRTAQSRARNTDKMFGSSEGSLSEKREAEEPSLGKILSSRSLGGEPLTRNESLPPLPIAPPAISPSPRQLLSVVSFDSSASNSARSSSQLLVSDPGPPPADSSPYPSDNHNPHPHLHSEMTLPSPPQIPLHQYILMEDGNGATALHWAVLQGRRTLFERLLSLLKDDPSFDSSSLLLDVLNKSIKTEGIESNLLLMATDQNDIVLTHQILDHGVQVNPNCESVPAHVNGPSCLNAFRSAWRKGLVRLATECFMLRHDSEERYSLLKGFPQFSDCFSWIDKDTSVIASVLSSRHHIHNLVELAGYAAHYQFHFDMLVYYVLPRVDSPSSIFSRTLKTFYQNLEQFAYSERASDAEMVFKLVRLQAIIKDSMARKPLEKIELESVYDNVERMLGEAMSCEVMNKQENIKLVLCDSLRDHIYYPDPAVGRAEAFLRGSLMISLTQQLTSVFKSGNVSIFIENLFWSFLRKDRGLHFNGKELKLLNFNFIPNNTSNKVIPSGQKPSERTLVSKAEKIAAPKPPDPSPVPLEPTNSSLFGWVNLEAVRSVLLENTIFSRLEKFKNVRALRSNYIYFRYCPALMFLAEGVSKVFYLVLISVTCFERYNPEAPQNDNLRSHRTLIEYLLITMFISVTLQKFGTIIEIGGREKKVIKAFLTYFKDIYSRLEQAGHFFVVLWLIFSQYSEIGGSRNGVLVVSAVFYGVSLLRYLSINQLLGKLVLMIFAMIKDLARFAVVFHLFLIGFLISFTSLFMVEIPDAFGSMSKTYWTLISVMMGNVDFSIFIGTSYPQMGSILMYAYLVFSAILLMNILIAQMANSHNTIDETAFEKWTLSRAEITRSLLLMEETNPLCMLPPPLNLLLIPILPVHYLWIRLKNKPHESEPQRSQSFTSLAGTFSDIVLGLLVAPFAPLIELFLYLSSILTKTDQWVVEFSRHQMISGADQSFLDPSLSLNIPFALLCEVAYRLIRFFLWLSLRLQVIILICLYPFVYPLYVSVLVYKTLSIRTKIFTWFSQNGYAEKLLVEYEEEPLLVKPRRIRESDVVVNARLLRGKGFPVHCNPIVSFQIGKRLEQLSTLSSSKNGESQLWSGFSFSFPVNPQEDKSSSPSDWSHLRITIYNLDPHTGERTIIAHNDKAIDLGKLLSDKRFEGEIPVKYKDDSTKQPIVLAFAITVYEYKFDPHRHHLKAPKHINVKHNTSFAASSTTLSSSAEDQHLRLENLSVEDIEIKFFAPLIQKLRNLHHELLGQVGSRTEEREDFTEAFQRIIQQQSNQRLAQASLSSSASSFAFEKIGRISRSSLSSLKTLVEKMILEIADMEEKIQPRRNPRSSEDDLVAMQLVFSQADIRNIFNICETESVASSDAIGYQLAFLDPLDIRLLLLALFGETQPNLFNSLQLYMVEGQHLDGLAVYRTKKPRDLIEMGLCEDLDRAKIVYKRVAMLRLALRSIILKQKAAQDAEDDNMEEGD